jgi:hypothetical protein
MTMSISSSAVLVELNISVWTANKLDKDATDTVLASNSASKGSAQVRKNLMAGTDKRKKIADYAAMARLYHNKTTLAWSDKGSRLLPTSLFMDYKQNMNTYRNNMEVMINDFLSNYGNLVDLSKHHMGDLFNSSDYPSIEDLRDKFGFRLVFSPLPESGDFRLDIPSADLQELSSEYESSFNDRLVDAMKEPWNKLHKMLTHMSEKLTDEEGVEDDTKNKKRYHDTFITNAQDLCGLLTHLNITKDPKLEEARRSLEHTMLGIEIEDIKEHVAIRSDVKAKVDAILNKFDW